MSNIILCATPYAFGKPFFYFSSIDEYNEKYEEQLQKYGIEEYEFDFIDGTDLHEILYQACKSDVFEVLEILEERNFSEQDAIKLYVCTRINGDSVEDALNNYENICIYHGTKKDYANEIFQWDLVPEFLHNYIDIDQFIIDLECNGEIFELDGDLDGWLVVK